MKTLRSYIAGKWHQARGGFATLVDPSTEEPVARASSRGVDFAAALEWARKEGGPALRRLTFGERGELLKAMASLLREGRDELLELSRVNNGTTRQDGNFDIGGGSGTLAYYAGLARGLGDRSVLVDGDGVQLARDESFWGQHVLVPRHGVAVFVNAFNFPLWGFAEKAACALAAGMPMIVKPATATALVTERSVEMLLGADILPPGALQLVCGGTGDLLERLGPQDVLAFTGSAETARIFRTHAHLSGVNVRLNVEADSLNAAVLAPDVGEEGATMAMFLKDVARELTQKAGQKCTAVRRILVPAEHLTLVREHLTERLQQVITGNPADESVTMGPLATAGQLEDAVAGAAELMAEAETVLGDGRRADGVASPAGKGYFFAPTLLEATDALSVSAIHRREVFAPLATLLPYDGTAAEAAEIVALGGGTLVTSVYGDDEEWLGRFLAAAGSTTGRIYLGSESAAGAAPGSGVALPQTKHGGPGRAGGGEELAGLAGLRLYMQRVALQGSRRTVEAVIGVDGG
jgi:oxepin-CoA hydrolase/3-oxo-5,6-dehydrosuberyl-CoA semialdehyde dehydrogenase